MSPADDRPLVATGRHRCMLERAQPTVARSSGNPMWNLRWRVTAEDDPDLRRLIFDRLVFTPRAIKRAKELYAECGVTWPGEAAAKPSDIEGSTLWVRVIHEEWQGEARAAVPWDGYERIDDRQGDLYEAQAPPAAEARQTAAEEAGDWPGEAPPSWGDPSLADDEVPF